MSFPAGKALRDDSTNKWFDASETVYSKRENRTLIMDSLENVFITLSFPAVSYWKGLS